MDFSAFEYMAWAKEHLGKSGFNLVSSGMSIPPAQIFTPDPSCVVPKHLPGYGGDWELARRIGARYQANPSDVLISFGASQTMYLLWGALLQSGDRVIVETPCYEPLHKGPALFGAGVELLERRLEEGYRLDLDRLRSKVNSKTKLLQVTHLHNPSGAAIRSEEIEEASKILAKQGGYVLVNEIYREFLLGEPAAFRLAPNVITVSSLTKAFGLGPLRIGWAIGPRKLVEKAKALNDYLSVNNPSPSVQIATNFFDNIGPAEERIRQIQRENRPVLDQWLKEEKRVECHAPPGGIICFPKLRGVKNTRRFGELLAEKFETNVVPGEFFEAPGHLRIGFGGEPKTLREGLQRVSAALSSWREPN